MNYCGRFLAGRRPVVARVLAAGLCLLSFTRTDAQAPAGALPFAGTQVFRRHVLHDLFKLTPVTTIKELEEKPRSSLLVVFGETESLKEVGITPPWLDRFRAKGGTVLFASDRPDGGLLRSWGLEVTRAMVHQNARVAYLNQEGCPWIKEYADPRHPLFQGLSRGLATNQPTYFDFNRQKADVSVLATFPASCWIIFGNHPRVVQGDTWPYIVGSDRGAQAQDRMVVIAGHGLFMNGMMAQRDNDNLAFACNCIRWLTEGGKRKHVLFLEEGTVQSTLDVPLKALPLPPIPPSRVVNKMLRGLEKERFFRKLFDTFFDRNGIQRALVLLASALLLVYGISRLLRSRHRIESTVPLLAGGGLPADTELPVMTQRDRDVVRGGNFWEAARVLARSCFDKVGEPWQGHAAHAPPLLVAGGWRRRLQLARLVRQLWELAHGARPVPVTPRMFAQVTAHVQEVQAALADGTLRFEEAASPEKRLTGKGRTL